MNIDYENLKELYGDEIIDIIEANIDIIEKNFETMEKLGFEDIEGIFERSLDAFLYFPKSFENKMQNLIKTLGSNYVEMIENDVSYMEKL